MSKATLYTGDAKETLRDLPESSVQTCVTSAPYWGLRDYGEEGQLGLEDTPEEYVSNLCDVFDDVRRVLREDGTLWLNLGDTYYANKGRNGSSKARRTAEERDFNQSDGTPMTETRPQDRPHEVLKGKDLTMIPSRVAMELQRRGWWVRSRVVWHKPAPMPESVTDRPTSSHEYIFLLSQSKQYYYDADSIRSEGSANSHGGGQRHEDRYGEQAYKNNPQTGQVGGCAKTAEELGGRNKRDVWTVNTKQFSKAHFAVYPSELIEPCIKAGSAEGDTVLDPFSGAGTSGVVALAKGRDYIGIDLSREYNEMAAERIRQDAPLMNDVEIREPLAAS